MPGKPCGGATSPRLHRLIAPLIVSTFVVGSMSVISAPEESRMYGLGSPFGVDDLPPGQLRSKFTSLPPQAKARARHWLESFAFPEHDVEQIRLDATGGVYYAEPGLTDAVEAAPETGEAPILQDVTIADVFTLHSRPGAANVVHLDFDGHVIAGTAWNGASGTLYAQPYDTDNNPDRFSQAEVDAMAAIWHRVAEDYAPFDIDVTTEPPPGGYGPRVGHVLITDRTDERGNAIYGSSAGGVAYVGVWGASNFAYYQPALVFENHLGNGYAHYVAEAASHELGHNLGLSHDGTSSVGYYDGHGSGYTSWAPIMGVGYYRHVTQWSRGEYADANNLQDDLAIIAGRLALSDDDHDDTAAGATPLAIGADGSVVATDPETDPFNQRTANKGVIETRSDVDLFYFDTSGGAFELRATPAWVAWYDAARRGANMDIGLALYDASGNRLALADDTSETDAGIVGTLPAGRYYLQVYGVGNALASGSYSDYASLGQYFITGTITGGGAGGNLAPVAGFTVSTNELGVSFTDTSSDPDGSIATWSWDFGDGAGSAAASPSHTYGGPGSYQVVLTVTDNGGAVASAGQTVSVSVTDSVAPSIVAPAAVSTEATGPLTTVALGTPTVSDNLDPTPGVVNDAPAGFPLGTTQVTWTATDDAGNTASATQAVTVVDSTAPVISAPPDINVESAEALSVALGSPDVADLVDRNPAVSSDAPDTFPVDATTEVTWTATDALGNSATAVQRVTVTTPVPQSPAAPSGLSTTVEKTGKGRSQVVSGATLSWNDGADNESGFEVQGCAEITTGKGRDKAVTCVFAEIGRVGANVTSFAVDMERGATHFRVRAFNDAGVSDWSNQAKL